MFIFALSIILLFCAFYAGCRIGHSYGKDEGWLDHYFETAEEERKKRDAQGRFKAQ